MEKTILNKKIILIFFILFYTNELFAGNNFIKSKIRQGELRLYFSSDIEGVKYFSLPSKDGSTKYVYDIEGATLPSGKGISQHSYKNIDSFRIAQNSANKLRIVIKSPQKALDKHAYKNNMLFIPLKYGKKASIDGITIENISYKKPYISTTNRKKYIVVIDAGHGGKDNGASYKNRTEKKIVLSIAKKVKRILQKDGLKVYMTRDSDRFVKLPKRTEFANKKMANIFVSIHANAAPTKKTAKIFNGIEIYYLSKAHSKRAKEAAEKENSVMFENKDLYTKNDYLSLLNREKIIESHKLGLDIDNKILSNIRKKYKVSNGGVKSANFWVLVGAQMPAILVETGYISHPRERKNLLSNTYQSLLAKGIAEGIERYLKNTRR
ncbi:MAG TPA: N-acetylmuramoyl-L-alanine amidase [Campylobacterales bacterium]|nr:N-acetylmuramoyl-L-alanine amidase [Campylobacterales bacterium]